MKYKEDFVIAENHKTGRIYLFFTRDILPSRNNKYYLDPVISNNLDKILVNNAELFINDDNLRKLFLLLNTVTIRLETAVEYMNKHSKTPKTEEQLYLFMINACIICDTFTVLKRELSDYIKQDIKENDTDFFKNVCMNEPWNLNEEECLSDKDFFEHFRSLAFAHPYKTDRRKIMCEKYGRQYSPSTVVDPKKYHGKVGLKIYSAKKEGTETLLFDFSILKNYIKSKYSEISSICDTIKEIVNKRREELEKIKVLRDGDPVKTLENLSTVSEKKCHFYHGQIEALIDFIQYENSVPQNEFVVKTYIQAIKDIITPMCDAVDNSEYMQGQNLIDSVLRPYSYKDSKLSSYMMKISDCYYYPNDKKIEDIRLMVTRFAKTYAKPVVSIDANNMSIRELFLLSCAVCYINQKEGTGNVGI